MSSVQTLIAAIPDHDGCPVKQDFAEFRAAVAKESLHMQWLTRRETKSDNYPYADLREGLLLVTLGQPRSVFEGFGVDQFSDGDVRGLNSHQIHQLALQIARAFNGSGYPLADRVLIRVKTAWFNRSYEGNVSDFDIICWEHSFAEQA